MSTLINDNEWKKIFVQDINDKLIASRKEFDKYKKTSKVVYLQQAGNKLFFVVENWLQVKYGRRISSYKELKQLVSKNKNDLLLVVRVSRLHYFFYQNIIIDDPEDIALEYNEIYKIMKNRVEKQFKRYSNG